MAVKNIRAEDLRELLRQGPDRIEIIDVRGKEEFEEVRIRGSKLIPLDDLPRRVAEIDWDKEVVFVCRSGRRSRLVAAMAAASGAEVKNLRFGILECFQDGGGEFVEFRSPRSPGFGRRE
jgi:rhodanese-related sulfurtransferase